LRLPISNQAKPLRGTPAPATPPADGTLRKRGWPVKALPETPQTASSTFDAPPSYPVVLAGFAAFANFYVPQPLLPLFTQVFHADKVSVSLTVTASTAGVALAAPFVGRLADRFGRRRVIVFSAWALAVVTMLAATSPGLTALIVWRFINGLLTPGLFAITVAYINDEWPRHMAGSAVSAYVSGTVFGGFVGRMMAGFAAEHLGWRYAFVFPGCLMLVIALILSRSLRPERRRRLASEEGGLLQPALMHLRNPRLLAVYTAGFCVLFTLVGMFTYVSFHLSAPPFSMGPSKLGSIFFVYLVGATMTPLFGRFIDRFGHRYGVIAGSALSIAGALITLGNSLWMVLAGLAVCCTGVFTAQTAASSFIGVAAKQFRALAVGLYVTFYYVGGSVGSTVPGWLWRTAGWPGCVGLVILMQIVLMLIASFGWKQAAAPVPARECESGEAAVCVSGPRP
jgi:predicted MFS family arabinose efflux permease